MAVIINDANKEAITNAMSPPSVNYDTALYALQENVVLKQRLEEDKRQYIGCLEEYENKLRLEISNKELYQRRVEKLQFEVNWQQNKLKELSEDSSANTIAFAILILLFVDFAFNVWFVFNLGVR